MTKRKRKRNRRVTSQRGLFTQLIEDPFAGLSLDERIRVMADAGRSAAEEFSVKFSQLQASVAQHNPLALLSSLASNFLTAGVTVTGKTKPLVPEPLNPSHVELAQALVLCIDPQKLTGEIAEPSNVQEVYELLLDVGYAFTAKRFVEIEHTSTDLDRAVLRLQERLRIHTQSVRNWGYFKRVVAVLRSLYGGLDKTFERRYGLSATAVINVFERHLRDVERAMTVRMERLAAVFRADNIDEMVHSYYQQFALAADDGDGEGELIELFHRRNVSRESAQFMLLAHSELGLIDAYTISLPDLAREIAVEPEALQRVFSCLAYCFGDLAEVDPEHLFLDNPVWTKPLIQLSAEQYFCALPQVFFSFSLRIMDGLFDDGADGRRQIQKRRADFLEDEVCRTFRESLPGATILPNIRWSCGDEEFENDLCVKLDTVLLIVEAKSAAISESALRGAPKRTQRHIKDLFEAPAQQSARLQAELERWLEGPSATAATFEGRLLNILVGLKEIHRLAVTLEDFATIQAHMGHIADAGWLKCDVPPVMTLADLQVIFTVLSNTADKIHYLVTRGRLQRELAYLGDELDLLGLYVDTSFDLGDGFYNSQPVLLAGCSAKIDEYFAAQDQDISRRLPQCRRTQWWDDLIISVERRALPGWLECSRILVSIGHDSQKRAEKWLKKAKKRVKRDWRRPRCQNSVVLEPGARHDSAIALMAYRHQQRGERVALMQGVAETVFGRSHAARCLVVAIDIDDSEYPCNTIALIQRPVV